jgi:di/tricarboxylate transporter
MQAGVPNLLSAIMVATGANAGNLSPISAVGAMVNGLMAKIGLPGQEWKVWAANFLAHVLVAIVAYLLFGGPRLLRAGPTVDIDLSVPRFERRHWLTIGVAAAWMVAVIALRVHVGLAAFAAGTLLVLARAADERDVIPRIPLDIIFMVTGVTMLVAVLEATGGMDLFTGMIARVANPSTLNAVIAFVTGIISTYSSTSGVVLPAFLPMVPGLVRQVGGGDPLAVALSINVGSALVDVSPLSTLGALCVATVVDPVAARDLFRKLLIWGLSMAVVGAVLCGLLAGSFARL